VVVVDTTGSGARPFKVRFCGQATHAWVRQKHLRPRDSQKPARPSKQKKQISAHKKAMTSFHALGAETLECQEAAHFVSGPKNLMAVLEAEVEAVEEAGEAMKSLTGDELAAFATPASTLEKVEKLQTSVAERAKAVQKLVKKQNTAVAAVTPQTAGTGAAKKELGAIKAKVQEMVTKVSKMATLLKKQCKTLADTNVQPAAEGIRKHASAKKAALDKHARGKDILTGKDVSAFLEEAEVPEEPASADEAPAMALDLPLPAVGHTRMRQKTAQEKDEEAEEDEDEDDEEDDGEAEEEEEIPKKRKGAASADAPAAKKGKSAGISAELEAKAKKLGFLLKLRALVENPKVTCSASDVLAELQKRKGSVVAAKKALLGA